MRLAFVFLCLFAIFGFAFLWIFLLKLGMVYGIIISLVLGFGCIYWLVHAFRALEALEKHEEIKHYLEVTEDYFQDSLTQLANHKGISPPEAFQLIHQKIYREMMKVDKDQEYELYILTHAATARYLSNRIPQFKKKFDQFIREASI